MAKIKSFGVSVTVDGITIGNLTDVSIPEVDVTDIDVTTHDSTGGYKEYVGGLKDGGIITLSGDYNSADAGQTYLRDGDNQGADPAVSCIITFSDGSSAACNVIVKGYGVTNPLDDVVGFTSSLRITGPVTYSPAA